VFIPPARHSLEVVKTGVGRRTLALTEAMFAGRVEHVDAFELWVVPTTPADKEQRLLFVGQHEDGHTIVFETTLALFRAAGRELTEEH
jgi:hypothetical protein